MKTGNTLANGFVSGEFTFRPIQVRTPYRSIADDVIYPSALILRVGIEG